MKTSRILIGMIFLLGLMNPAAWAAKVYVTDSFKVTLRSGPSTENKIIAILSSGQVLEVLEEKEDWSRVRLTEEEGKNKEGWILSRYIITRLPWEMQTRFLQQKNASLREELDDVRNRLDDSRQKQTTFSEDLKQRTEVLKKLQEEYATLKNGAEEYLQLKSTHEATRISLESAKNELQALNDEIEELRSSQVNRWFATGALVLLCGLLIGLLMGRQQKKRRSLYQ